MKEMQTSLVQFARDLGICANQIRVGQGPQIASTLQTRLQEGASLMREAGITAGNSGILNRLLASPRTPWSLIWENLVRLEGEILGRLAGRMPDDEMQRLSALFQGKGELTRDGVLEADRHGRFFIEAYLKGRGIRRRRRPRYVKDSPPILHEALSDHLRRKVFVKPGSDQPISRGATHFLLGALLAGKDPREVRVVAASRGHHGMRVTQAAYNLGFRHVEIYLPHDAPMDDEKELEKIGAKVVRAGETFDDAEWEAKRRCSHPSLLFVPAVDHLLVQMGKGAIAVGLEREMARYGLESYGVLGHSRMIASIATYFDPLGLPVVAVEPEGHASLLPSFVARRILNPPLIHDHDRDGEEVVHQRVIEAGFEQILRHVEDVIVVSEEEFEGGVAFLADHRHERFPPKRTTALLVGAVLYHDLPLRRRRLPDDLPLVIIDSGRPLPHHRLSEIGRRHGNGGWRNLHPEKRMRPLREALGKAGFMQGMTVKNLRRTGQGLRLIETVVANLPQGWDLIDALRHLEIGPYRENGMTPIDQLLRNLGQYVERAGGLKEAALLDPLINQGIPPRKEDRPLLKVITFIVDLYLQRDGWSDRLWPHLPHERRLEELARLRELNDRVKQAI